MFSNRCLNSLVIFCICVIFNFKSNAQQVGLLDSSFNSNGIVLYDFGSNGDFLRQVAIQSDDKIVACGTTGNSSVNGFIVLRYNTSGTLDSTFDNDGQLITVFDSTSFALSIGNAIQPDGKIVVGGWVEHSVTGKRYLALARYESNGVLDSTFDVDGKAIFRFDNKNSYCQSVSIQADGKIVVGGSVAYNSNYNSHYLTARINSDGSIDSSFGTNGGVISILNSDDCSYVYSTVIQPDNKILVAGVECYDFAYGPYRSWAVIRYNSDGSLDSTFIGFNVTPSTGDDNGAASIILQPDNKIVVAGSAGDYWQGYYDFTMYRLHPNGIPDSTFGINGKVSSNFTGYDVSLNVRLLSTGKFILSGFSSFGSTNDFSLACYNSNGTLDSSFGNNGFVSRDFSSSEDKCYAMQIQADGKIVLAGIADGDFALARYLSELNVGIIENQNSFELYYIYPNPINETTTLNYELIKAEKVTVRLLDINAKHVETFIANEERTIGKHDEKLLFARSIVPGIYFLEVSTNYSHQLIKIVKQ